MKAGRNTPQSVLAYIDANTPTDPNAADLARQLGYSPTRYRRLKEKHGDGLVAHLERELRRRDHADAPRFLARQHGQRIGNDAHQYVDNVHSAIDPLEVVRDDLQTSITQRAHEVEDVVKAEELARREARRRAERLRQAELELRQKGHSHERYARVIDGAIEQMRRQAAA